MENKIYNIKPIEKIISILSYITMGLVGLFFLIISYTTKKKLKFFLLYNITQSILISVIFAVFKLFINLILSIIALVPFLDFIVALLNLIISFKIVTIPLLHLSFSVLEIFITLLLIYIIFGISLGRIFYIPKLTKIMNKILSEYK